MADLLYLKDFDVETCVAKILSITNIEDDKTDIVLDKTCFYPRGGGQDWDMGKICSTNAEFYIEEVRLDEDGSVHHIGKLISGNLKIGDAINGTVDAQRRSVNTRLHSGGHVIDMAIDSLGLDWVATKGQHYPHLSAVEYNGRWDPEKSDTLRYEIELRANEIIHTGTDNKLVFMPVAEMHKICRHVPENIPKNKPGRVVVYGDNFGIPCGGTHVKNLSQIGTIKVPKIKEKKGVIRVNYEVEGLNI